MSEFRPLSALVGAEVERQVACFGPHAARLLRWMRGHGGVRTLAEIWAWLGIPVLDVEVLLDRMERVGLLCRREMMTEAGDVPCWWAPRVPGHVVTGKERV